MPLRIDAYLLILARSTILLFSVVPVLLVWKVHDLKAGTNADSGVAFRPNPDRLVLRFQPPPVNASNTTRKSLGTFKILQVADIHLGERSWEEWGPEQDRKTWLVLDKVLRDEQPNLIVLSGDQLTANDCKTSNGTRYYQKLGMFLSQYRIPWALIFGNHDDMDFDAGAADHSKHKNNISRQELMTMDQTFAYSLSRFGPPEVTGVSNYNLLVYNDSEDEILLQLVFLDSGGGDHLEQKIDTSHIDYLKLLERDYFDVPAVAFQHIPTTDFAYRRGAYAAAQSASSLCSGFHGEGIAPVTMDAGIVPFLLNQSNRYVLLAAGHDHGNDYCCRLRKNRIASKARRAHHDSLHLCFGRHSGYGGYGHWERGVRVYQAELLTNTSGTSNHGSTRSRRRTSSSRCVHDNGGRAGIVMDWTSWVRLETGEVTDYVELN